METFLGDFRDHWHAVPPFHMGTRKVYWPEISLWENVISFLLLWWRYDKWVSEVDDQSDFKSWWLKWYKKLMTKWIPKVKWQKLFRKFTTYCLSLTSSLPLKSNLTQSPLARWSTFVFTIWIILTKWIELYLIGPLVDLCYRCKYHTYLLYY